jgi:hypothetical protein
MSEAHIFYVVDGLDRSERSSKSLKTKRRHLQGLLCASRNFLSHQELGAALKKRAVIEDDHGKGEITSF